MRRADEMADATRFSVRDNGLLMSFTDFRRLARTLKVELPTMAQIIAESGSGKCSIKNYETTSTQ